jgi:Ala-tRNA(Pro) deacylase
MNDTPQTPRPAASRASLPPLSTPATRAELFAWFDALGIAHTTHEHRPVFTVAESRGIEASIPGGHSKNLFLKSKKGEIWLVSALHETRVDLNALARHLGAARFSFGKPELLMECLGVTPGAVTVFGAINDAAGRVSIALDAALMAHDPVNFHPLANDATTGIAPGDLLRFLAATGHAPVIVDFTALEG